MGLICLFFPAVIFVCLRRKIIGVEFSSREDNIIDFCFEYVWGNLCINGLILFVRVFIGNKGGNVYYALNEYSDFAVKYLLFALILAAIAPHSEKYLRNNVSFSFRLDMSHRPMTNECKSGIVICYGAVMAFHHFIRIFDNCFWGDEGLVVNAARKNWGEMLEYVAVNGHSPFHYAFSWAFVRIFGESGFTYHFSAALPYFILIAVIAVMVRRWFGSKTALILMTLNTFLGCAVIYNLEIRMYVWCQMFVFLAYLMTYGFYRTKENKYYILVSFFSLGAVYSHYFALAAIGLIYFVMLIFIMKTNRKDIWKVMVSGGSILVLLMPWLVYAKRTKGVIMSDYNIGEVSWYDCMEFIFHSKYSMILLVWFFTAILIGLVYDLGIISFVRCSNGKKQIHIRFVLKEMHLGAEWIWIASGVLAVFGTIAAAKMISTFIYPIITLRYLYTSYMLIWLLLAIGISKCRGSRLWTVALIAFIFATCYPKYTRLVRAERSEQLRLESTLEGTVSDIDERDVIYTNITHFAWTVGKVYYPDTPNYLFGHAERWGPDKLPLLDFEAENWLFLGEPITEEITADLAGQGYMAEMVVEKGYIGTGDVWVYRIENMEEGERWLR